MGADFITPHRANQNTYPVTVHFLGDEGQPVGNEVFTVSHRDGRNPMTIACNTANIYMELPLGRYTAIADMADGPTKTINFRVTRSARMQRIDVHFPAIAATVPK